MQLEEAAQERNPIPLLRVFLWSLAGFTVLIGSISLSFLLPFALLGIAFLATKPRFRKGWPAVFTGIGLGLLLVAALQLGQTGSPTCDHVQSGVECGETTSPLPWLISGVLFLGGGIGVTIVSGSRPRMGPSLKTRGEASK